MQEAQWALTPWPSLPMLGEGEGSIVGAALSRTLLDGPQGLGEFEEQVCPPEK
jgi:hypothetical protein